MRNAELDEIRALLRAQTEATPAPTRKGLLGGLLRKPAPSSRGPLNLTPIEAPRPRVQAEPAHSETRAPALDAAPEEAAPMLFLAPRRERFGLADEGSRPAPSDAAPLLKLRSVVETPDELLPRRRGPSLAATEAAGLGADEILELHDMLSERMPQLLSQIDLEAKLAPPPGDEPSIASIVSAAEAARASVEQAAAVEAWSKVKAQLASARWDDSAAAHERRRRLTCVHEELNAEHDVLEGDLLALRRARAGHRLAA